MENFAISAGHKRTAHAAMEVLSSGGNAFDATIAAMITSWISEPIMSSPGGGGFANIVTANRKSFVVDFFCQTPKRKRAVGELDFFPVAIDFKTVQETFHIGRGSIAVPGIVAGAFAIHEKFGTIPIGELMQPAIHLAKNGFLLDDFSATLMGMVKGIIGHSPCTKGLFEKEGRVLQKGDLFKMPAMVDFLETLAVEGQDLFYRGEIAQAVVKDQKDNGGNLLFEDFEDYEVFLREPLKMNYRDKTILTNPLPSLGGVVLLLIANETKKLTPEKSLFDQEHFENIVRIFEKIVAIKKTPENLLQKLMEINVNSSHEFSTKTMKKGGTTHMNIVDKLGNAVSMTLSNGEGSGYFIPNTGIHFNNMLGESALLPDGFHSWQTNVRLSSLMTPTIVVDKRGNPEIITGSGGAGRIPYAIAQVLHNLLDYDVDVNTAVAASRVHVLNEIIKYETGYDLRDFTHRYQIMEWQQSSLYFGGVHTITNVNGTYKAAGDIRREGVGIVG